MKNPVRAILPHDPQFGSTRSRHRLSPIRNMQKLRYIFINALVALLALSGAATRAAEQGSLSDINALSPTKRAFPQDFVHGLVNLEFSDYHLTPRGINLQNRGLIFQPLVRLDWNLYKPATAATNVFINDLYVTTAVWNDIDTVRSGVRPGHWNEIDFTVGPNVRFLNDWTLESPFTAFRSETASFETCWAWDPRLTYHDHFIKNFSVNPYVEFFYELHEKITVILVPSKSQSSYFGFEFELPCLNAENAIDQVDLFPDAPKPENRPEVAMEKLEKLLQVAALGSDDDIAELVDEIHPRAVKKTSEFLDYLAEQDAWCAVEFNETIFRFGSVEQVIESAERLRSNNIKEFDETHRGEFQGVLPKSRTFEFKVLDQDHILRGKVGPEIEDADVLNKIVHKHLTAKFHVIQVGQGTPRFTLQRMADITDQS